MTPVQFTVQKLILLPDSTSAFYETSYGKIIHTLLCWHIVNCYCQAIQIIHTLLGWYRWMKYNLFHGQRSIMNWPKLQPHIVRKDTLF